jgi:hypothetical protein
MLQTYTLPKIKNTKISYKPSNSDYTIVTQQVKVPISILDKELSAELKDKKLLSKIKKARLEYQEGSVTSEEEIYSLLEN